jgi:hypothetical protein
VCHSSLFSAELGGGHLVGDPRQQLMLKQGRPRAAWSYIGQELAGSTCCRHSDTGDLRGFRTASHPRRRPERSPGWGPCVSWSRIKIPWSKRNNYRIFMKLVGPVGLEPTTKGFTIPRTRFCCRRKVTIFLSPYRYQTETEPIPNLIMGDSEWVQGKPKKRNELFKPKSELLPNRICDFLFRDVLGW